MKWYEKPDVKIILDALAAQYITDKKNMSQKRSQGVFVTLNPSPEYDSQLNLLPNILEDIKGLLNKKWVHSLVFCVEQRATVKPYHGLHFHILILFENYYKKSYVIRILASYFQRKKSSMKLSQPSINVRMCKKHNDVINCFEYIKGFKEDDKLSKSNLDVHFRKDNNLQPFYVVGKLPF